MHREPAAPNVCIVDDVIVYERGGVNKLNNGCVEDGLVPLISAQARGHQQQRWSDTLATAILDVAPDLRNQLHPGLDVTSVVLLDRFQVAADGFEDLGQVNRG